MSRALGLHHVTQRNQSLFKRIVQWVTKRRNLDDFMVFIAVVYPLSILPQVIKIIEIQDASSISILSFSLKSLFALPWILYGIKHKSLPIVLSNVLWFLGYMGVLTGAILY